jgi:hypothetical protein
MTPREEPSQNNYEFTFDNRTGGTPVETGDHTAPYKVSEHLLWAPRKMRVASIGAGASGIMMCYKKEKEFGDSIDLVVYESKFSSSLLSLRKENQPKLTSVNRLGYPKCGGVWYANKYPGCRCDVPSPSYQFSFAPKPDWSRYYSPSAEIQTYYEGFARDHGYLDRYIKLSHEVTQAIWDETTSEWILSITETTESGEKLRSFEDRVDFLVANIGVLNTWRWPDIPNRETFRGEMTHSANYDTSLDLAGKTVIVIGSGASSIQIIPAIRKIAGKVVSFYRTPQWISPGLAMEGYTDVQGRNFDCMYINQPLIPRNDGVSFGFVWKMLTWPPQRDCVDTDEQKQFFASNPAAYLEHRKALETKINSSFRGNIAAHQVQKFTREVRLAIVSL